ncbi:hypothetical protein [Feifania hominis]|uniref:SLH domain-containing protein n=1 Tax=Feifania hominis TaxID=2763660 RepID=A0A926DBQ3_9FIRM|nr:hypothetical protein [Feifania hominis]MBC8535153.1 hypothetical protein [Feifania hominis]
MKTKRTGKFLALLLALVLVVGLVPTAVAAEEDTSWMSEPVDRLNEILGSDVFVASTAPITYGEIAAVLRAAGYDGGKFAQNTAATATRADGCEAIAVLFQLPVGDGSAIQYFFDHKYINGTAEGELNESGALSAAEFAVLTDRLYSELGGFATPPTTPGEGEGESTTPGEGESEGDPTTPGGESGSSDFDGLASEWAKEELKKADSLGLIPDCLVDRI